MRCDSEEGASELLLVSLADGDESIYPLTNWNVLKH